MDATLLAAAGTVATSLDQVTAKNSNRTEGTHSLMTNAVGIRRQAERVPMASTRWIA
jgi:hypothetical protein